MGRTIAHSQIAADGTITIPEPVLQYLGLKAGDEIAYVIDDTGVRLMRPEAAAEEDRDPAILAYLDFLAKDVKEHPERLLLLTPEFQQELAALTEGIEGDWDDEIVGPVSL